MKKMTEKQIKAANLQIATNMSTREIAEEVGVHINTLYNWNNDEFYVAERNKIMQKEMNKYAAKALRTMIELMDSEQDNVRYSAAKDILDRSGFKATDKLEIDKAPKIKVVWEEE